MAKKQFDTSDLLEGLTVNPSSSESPVTDTPPQSVFGSRRGRKPMSSEEERVSFVANKVLYAKCRAIADNEGLKYKDVMNKGMELAVAAYEQKHGPVRIKKSKKNVDINDVF